MDNKLRFEQQKKQKIVLLSVLAAVVIIAIVAGVVIFLVNNKPTIKVGSKAFTEQQILGHIISDMIEEHTDYKVDRKIGLGGTAICYEALQTGAIDVYVDYSGPVYLNQLAQPFKQMTGDKVYSIISELLAEKDIYVGKRLGFYNNYELTVKREFAEKYNLKTIYDLKPLVDIITLAPTFEYVNRDDGMLGINKIYGISFTNVVPMEAGLRYTALENGEADVINTFTTDGMKYKLDLVALEDPEMVHIIEEAVPLFFGDTYEKYPDVVAALAMLEGKISNDEMMEMNYKVDVERALPENVAHDFLLSKGLIGE